MMVSFAKTAFYVGMLSSGAVAWSSVGPSDRRGFLQNASRTAGVIGTVGVCGGEIFVESAQAATQELPRKTTMCINHCPGLFRNQISLS